MCDDGYGTLIKHYLDKNDIPYELDKSNYKLLRINTNGLTNRQIKLIKKIVKKVDKMEIASEGFGLIVINLGHYGGLE